jgi:hypothetical protein
MDINRDREQALKRALGMDTDPPRFGSGWIGFLLGVITAWLAMGVIPYWRLIVQIWQGCVQ